MIDNLRKLKDLIWPADRSSLLSLVKEEQKKFYKQERTQFIKDSLATIYIPSIRSFLRVVALLVLSYFLISVLPNVLDLILHRINNEVFDILERLTEELTLQNGNNYQILIAIHATVGLIILALVLFIAESLRDDDTTDRARVLLKESYLFPLAVAWSLFLACFLLVGMSSWIVLLGIVVYFFAFIGLWSTIAVLLSKHKFYQKRVALLQERLQQSIDLAARKRFADNILLGKLDRMEIKLRYPPLCLEDRSNYHFFSTEKRGVISDINLSKLKEFADLVEKEANKNGYSFEDKDAEPASEVVTSDDTETTKEPKEIKYSTNRSRYINRIFHDVVDEEHDSLFFVDKNIVKEPKTLAKLKAIADKIFTIKKGDNFPEEVRCELSGVKDQFIAAISAKRLGRIEDLRKLYIRLAESFLEYMKKYGGGHSFEHARKERHSLFGGWEEIGWLSSDVRVIFEKAIESQDKEIIRKVGYLPIAVATRATKYHDHYLFQEFIRFCELLYLFTHQQENEELKTFMIDRSWRYLREAANFHVESRMRKDDLSEEELKSLRDFAIYFFVILQNILKRSFEYKDLDSFRKFREVTDELFDHFAPASSVRNAEYLKGELARSGLSNSDRESIKQSLHRQELLEGIKKDIERRRRQMLFGLASWILSKVIEEENSNLRDFYKEIQSSIPSNLEDLTRLFLESYSFDVEEFWGWDWWNLKSEDKLQWIDTLGKLQVLYCVKTLELIALKSDDEIARISLPHNRDFAVMVENNGQLIRILNDISNKREMWRLVLSAEAMNKVAQVKEVFRKTKAQYEREETEEIRDKTMDETKVDQFKNEVVKGFNNFAVLRDIFKHYGLYEDKTGEKYSGTLGRFGVNTVKDKASFFKEWHVDYGDGGTYYGYNLASSEDWQITENIVSHCTTIEGNNFENTLEKIGNLSDVVILATHDAWYSFFSNLKALRPKWQEGCPQIDVKGFAGCYLFKDQSIPIFEIDNRKTDKHITVLNKSRLGKLIQHSPLNEGDDERLKKDIFYINVQAFSEKKDLLEKFIAKPPEWLRKVGDETQQREQLGKLVLVHIFERFEYVKHKDFEGYLLKLAD